MSIAFNFSSPKTDSRFPAHGWSTNSDGIQLLWLPISSFILSAPDIRQNQGIDSALTAGQVREIRSFSTNLTKLVLALRELHEHIRLMSIPPIHSHDMPNYQKNMDAQFTLPLRVDLVFSYLRRLADDFTRSSRFVLFQHPGSAPQKYKNLIKCSGEDLLHDKDALLNVLKTHSSWFGKLRNRSNPQEKGIRDILEHRGVTINTHHSQNGGGPWELHVDLSTPDDAPNYVPNLIDTIREIIGELCELWTGVCSVTGNNIGYRKWIAPSPWGDCFAVTGIDEDVCGFWPQL